MRAELCDRYALSPREVDDLTFDHIQSLWTGGKRSKGIPVTSVAQARRVAKDWRRALGL